MLVNPIEIVTAAPAVVAVAVLAFTASEGFRVAAHVLNGYTVWSERPPIQFAIVASATVGTVYFVFDAAAVPVVLAFLATTPVVLPVLFGIDNVVGRTYESRASTEY